MFKFSNYFLLFATIIVSALVFPACNKATDVSKQSIVITPKPGVYVCGYTFIYKDSSTVAKVWKDDGTVVFLKGSKANVITSQGSDLYVAGVSGGMPAYWKNGIMTTMQSALNAQYWEITGIAVSGSDVYIIGYGYFQNDTRYACWKNGVISLFSKEVEITGVAASGSDYYLAGSLGPYSSVATRGILNPVYWKNGTPIPTGDFYPIKIAASGNDVYITGVTSEPGNPKAYWKNSVVSKLNSILNTCRILIKGADVYFAGDYYDPKTPKFGYVKNSVETLVPINLSDYPGYSYYSYSDGDSDIDKNGNLYFNGSIIILSTNVKKNGYWKNGSFFTLDTDNSTFVTGVAVIN